MGAGIGLGAWGLGLGQEWSNATLTLLPSSISGLCLARAPRPEPRGPLLACAYNEKPLRTFSGASPSASNTQECAATMQLSPAAIRLPRSLARQREVSNTICHTALVGGAGNFKSIGRS